MNIRILLTGMDSGSIRDHLRQLDHLLSGLGSGLALDVKQHGAEDCLAEIQSWAALRPTMAADASPDLTLVCGTEAGRYHAMALAAVQGCDCHTGALALIREGNTVRVLRKIYSTHLDALFPAEGCIIIPSDTCPRADYTPCSDKTVSIGQWNLPPAPGTLLESIPLEQVEDLSQARLVLLGGKGLGSRENFRRLEALAEKLGASCACTRPVALSGWADYGKVTGISGWRLQADICIAFGVSGAAPLLAGLENVGRVIAINNDKSASIFRIAREGVVADCIEILTAMESLADSF